MSGYTLPQCIYLLYKGMLLSRIKEFVFSIPSRFYRSFELQFIRLSSDHERGNEYGPLRPHHHNIQWAISV